MAATPRIVQLLLVSAQVLCLRTLKPSGWTIASPFVSERIYRFRGLSQPDSFCYTSRVSGFLDTCTETVSQVH